MTALVLKRGKFSRPSGQWSDEDYDVLADGRVVGRILEEGSHFGPPELRWGWSITVIVPATPATHGTAATLEDDQGLVSRKSDEGEDWRAVMKWASMPFDKPLCSGHASAVAPNRTYGAHWQIVAMCQQAVMLDDPRPAAFRWLSSPAVVATEFATHRPPDRVSASARTGP
jgi:hypothetical protein